MFWNGQWGIIGDELNVFNIEIEVFTLKKNTKKGIFIGVMQIYLLMKQ